MSTLYLPNAQIQSNYGGGHHHGRGMHSTSELSAFSLPFVVVEPPGKARVRG